jgi:hypothetical protein
MKVLDLTQISQKKIQNHHPEHYPSMERGDAHDSYFASFFGDVSQK